MARKPPVLPPDVVGRKIVALRRSRWEPRQGVDLPGITGPVWHDCDLFAKLDDGRVLRLVNGETGLRKRLPLFARRMRLEDEQGEDCLGDPILDVVDGEEPVILVLLTSGRYLEISLQAGGTYFEIGELSDRDPEDLDDGYCSLVTGQRRDLREFG